MMLQTPVQILRYPSVFEPMQVIITESQAGAYIIGEPTSQ